MLRKFSKKASETFVKARVALMRDEKGSPALETVALITFIVLVIAAKSGDLGDTVGDTFDAVVTSVTNAL